MIEHQEVGVISGATKEGQLQDVTGMILRGTDVPSNHKAY